MGQGILIVDDSLTVRNSIRTILEWHSLEICGEATNGLEAVQRVLALKHAVVLLDLNMPIMDGIAAAGEIKRLAPETKIVFLTVHESPRMYEATRLWCDAFIPKSEAGRELIPTLERLLGREHQTEKVTGKPYYLKIEKFPQTRAEN